MSAPQTRRKVMGRIDLTNGNTESTNGPPSSQARANVHTARINASSPVTTAPNATARKAKVSPSSIVSPGGGANVRSPFGAVAAASNHSNTPVVRSPLQSGEYAPTSSLTSVFPTRSSATPSSSRHATRSPSPSRMMASSSSTLRTGPSVEGSRSVSPSVASHRAKARPASQIFGDGVRINGASVSRPVAVPSQPLTAKVTPGLASSNAAAAASANAATRAGHVRAYSTLQSDLTRSAANLTISPLSRSRSPSPTLIKTMSREGRRISHGSTASLGGNSSLSSATGNPELATRQPSTAPASTVHVAAKRPSLSSLHALHSSRGYSEHSVGSGLESPLDLHSPILRDASSAALSPMDTGSLTSPPGQTYFPSPSRNNSSVNVTSPTVELDAGAVEAKTNRKILDLEITNKSLLAINSGLEVVKLKQAREIRELKRRAREGRGLGNRLGLDDGEGAAAGDGEGATSIAGSATDDEDEESEDEEAPLNVELEAAHQRCKDLIDAMVDQARHAILSKYEPEARPTGNRVLHPTEVDEMRRDQTTGETDDEDDHTAKRPQGDAHIDEDRDVEGVERE